MRARWIGLAIVTVVVTAKSASAYSDETLGFSISIPGGWRQIAIASEEKYIVARWQSEKEYFDKKEGGYFYSQKPELKVVLFDPKGKFSKETKDAGDGVTVITVNNPYKTYKDWVKSDGEGGRYISKEEEISVNGVPTTRYEVAYEKLTTPRHGLAFVYHAEDIDYCVTTEVLEQEWKKLSPGLLSALRTFKIFPRKGVLKRETTGGDSTETKGESDPTPEGRAKVHRETFDRKLKLCVERLTAGWTVKWSDAKGYVALSHADAKFTALILDQADGVRQWADETLGFFGLGTPGPQIIRIFKDWDEEQAFTSLSSHSNASASVWMSEITLSRREGFWGLGSVAADVYRCWLQDKNEELAWSLPPWLDNGIREWVSHAYFNGGKLQFRPDVDTVVALKTAAKQGTLIKVRDLLQMSDKDVSKIDSPGSEDGPIIRRSWGGAYQQSAGLVRYLLAGPGKSHPLTKDLLKNYVVNLDAYVEEHDKTPSGEGSKAPQTEEEEEARFKERKSYWDDTREKELLKSVFEKTFAEWKESDWATFEKSYRAFAN